MSLITRLDFNTIADGGDDATGAFQKLDANDVALDEAITAALADIAENSAALDALGTASGRDVGTAAGTVAAGDDSRFLSRGRRNLVICGDLRVNQRGTAGGAHAANIYGYDRWRTFGAAASFQLSADNTTITLNGTIGQVIETPYAGGATVTVSLSNPSGPVTINLRPDATTAAASGVIPAGAGLRSVTLAIPSAITGNLFLQLTTAAAVTFDGPAKRSGIQLEFGSFASAFETTTVAEQVNMAQRYYRRIACNGLTGVVLNTTNIIIAGRFGIEMRTAPIVTNLKGSYASGSFEILCGTTWGGAAGASFTGVAANSSGFQLQVAGFGGLTGGQPVIMNNVQPFAAFDAEL
jgi:hypothetical protein